MADIWMDVDVALSEVPVNIMPLIDDTDFKTREESVAYNQAGLDLVWNFVTTAGAMTQTAVTPTNTGGDYDWVNQGNGMYSIEIPASAGASINNDTEGFGWFTGYATGILPWRGPVIGFRASGINDKLIDSAYSTTRGLAGTALPDAAANAAGGLPISAAGGLNMDAQIGSDIDNIVSRIGSPSNLGSGSTLAANLVDIEGQTDDIGAAGAGLTAVPWNSAWAAQVNAEVLDVLNTDTFAEPSAPPAATASLVAKIGWLAILARNKITQTSTTQTLYADNGSTTVATSTVSDDGTTATRGEFA